VVDDTDPVVDDTDPVVDDTDPVADDTDPADDTDDPVIPDETGWIDTFVPADTFIPDTFDTSRFPPDTEFGW
jgi:hypothetical protein